MKNTIFLFSLFFSIITFSAHGQQKDILPTKGKEFWIGFLNNYNIQPNDTLKIFISSDRNTFGSITLPLQGYYQSFAVTANLTTQIIIPNPIAEHFNSDIIENKGIYLVTDDTVSVFALNFDIYTADATKVLPIQSLGTDYLVSSYQGGGNGGSEFLIVATEDQTEIQITPSVSLQGGKPANVPYNIILNRGQSYQAKASTNNGDVTGTRIVATDASGQCRPFAVFSGITCANIPVTCYYCDHIYEQEFPRKSWGKNYYIAPFSFATEYSYRIIADQNATSVTINGGAPFTLNSGQYYTQNFVPSAVCISASKPVNVTQYMEGITCASAGDPSMLFLNPEEQKIDEVTFATVRSNVITQHNANVIMKTIFTNQLSLDGVPISPTSFIQFPSCPEFSYLALPLTQGSHTLAADSGFTAYVYGTGSAESYAYSVGSFTRKPPIIADTVYCTSQTVTLAAPKPLFNAYWTTLDNPNVIIGYGQSITITPVTSEVYVVKGDALISGCASEYRFSVEVPTPPDITITMSTPSICQYGKVYLNASATPASASYVYSWTPTIDLDNPNVPNPVATPGVSRWYYCKVSTPSGCGYAVDSIYIDVLSIGNISNTKILYSPDNKICLGETLPLDAQVEKILIKDEFNPGTNASLWSNISLGTTNTNCGSVTGNALYFNGTGTRSATTNNFNVTAGGSIHFALKIANGVAPCDNAEVGENVVLEYSTNNGLTWTIINTYLESGFPNFKNVVAQIPAAAQTGNTSFRWRQLTNSGIGQDNWAIDNVIIGVINNTNISFNWSPASGLTNTTIKNPVASPTTSTTYTLITTDNVTSCTYKDSINIDVGQPFTLTTSNDTTLCVKTGINIHTTPNPAASGYTYSWTPVGSLSNPNISNPIANPAVSTTYNVTVTSLQGCVKTDDVVVTVNSPIKAFDATANQPSICLGGTSQLNVGETMIIDDFEHGVDNSKWLLNTGGIPVTSCGSVSGRALYFTHAGSRYVATVQQNFINGGTINFYLKIGTGTAPCDDADPGEDVVLEYSTNGGGTWNIISTFNEALYPFFTYISIPIPPAAQTATTQFRWRQLFNSGAGQDNWAIDNVMIQRNLVGSHTFSWTPTSTLNNPAIANPVATPTATTTYHVAAQNLTTGCNYADDVTVTVVPDFNISISNDTILCSKAVGVQLNANASPGTGYTYIWSPTAGLSNPTISNPIATPSSTTTYTVNVSLSGQCIKTKSVTVTVNNPLNNISITANPPIICQGQSTQLNTGELLLSDNFDPLVSSQWTSLTGTVANSCGSVSGNAMYFNNAGTRYMQTVSQNVLSGGTISFYLKVGSGAAPCDDADPGEDIMLEYSTNGGSTWNTITTLLESEYPYFRYVSIPIPAAAQTLGTTFRWRQISNSGIGQDNWAIDNVKIIRTISVPFTFAWTPATGLSNTTISNPVATPSTTTKYYVTIQNTLTNCIYKDSIVVSVAPDFNITASNDTLICSRYPGVQLNSNASPGSGYTYLWTPGLNLSNPNINNPIATPNSTTTYTVNILSSGGCVKTEPVTINANNPINQLQATASPTTLICQGQSSQLNLGDLIMSDNFDPINSSSWVAYTSIADNSCGSVSGNAMYFNNAGTRYAQTFGLNVSSGGNIGFYLKVGSGVSPCEDADPGEDIILEYSINGGTTWFAISAFNEALYPNFTYINVAIPVPARTNNTIFRWRQLTNTGFNEDVWAIDDLEISRTLLGTYTYTWTPAAGLSNNAISNPMATPIGTGISTYYVTAVNTSTNCTYQDSIKVTVVPSFTVDAGRDTTICKNNSVQFNPVVNPSGTYTYQWIPSTNLSASNIANPSATPQITTVYKVFVTSAAGCQLKDSLTINISGEAPLISLAASKTTVCKGETIQLSTISNAPCGLNNTACSNTIHTSTVGTGTNSTSFPFLGYYMDGKSQTIYTQTDLLAAGLVAGESIRSIAFNVVTKSSYAPYVGFTIKMGCTSTSQFSNTTFVTVPNVVYTPKNISTVLGWNTFTLDNPYVWDGISNLIVEVCFDNNSWTAYDYVYASPFSYNAGLYYYADNSVGCTFTVGYTSTFRPNMRINSCGIVNNSLTYSWTPTTGLSNPSSANTSAIVNATTNYVLTAGTGSCNAVKSILVSIDASNTVKAKMDTLCTNGQPIPLHATVTGSPAPTVLNCGAGTTPVTSPTNFIIGNGSSTVTTGGPFFGAYSDSRVQYIIPATELVAAGMSMGTITKIGFNVSNKFSTIPYNNFNVKIGCTNSTSLNVVAWEQVSTTVFGPVSYSTISGWNTLNLTTPYNWNGSSNLVVEICWDNSSASNYDYVTYTNTSYTSCLFSYASNSIGCTLPTSFSYMYRPNIVLTVCPPVPNTFSYSWTPTSGLNNPNILNPTANPASNAWYFITVNGGRCPVKDSVFVIPNQKPQITITPSTCQTDSVQLSASGGITYAWTPSTGLSNPNIANPKADPLVTTKYKVNVLNNLKCSNTDSVTIYRGEINPVLTIDTAICKGDSVQLLASGAYVYTWTPSTGLSNSHIPNPIAKPNITTTYTVTFSTTDGVCTSIKTVKVTVKNKPSLTLTPDTYVCTGDSVQLIASGADTYTWTPSTGLSFSNIPNPKAAPATLTVYKVLAKNSEGCESKDSVEVQIKIPPVFSITPDTSICEGEIITLKVNDGNPTFVTPKWTPGNLLGSAINVSPAIYTRYHVLFGDQFCLNEDSVDVQVLNNPVINMSNDTTICKGGTAQLVASGGINYAWLPITGLDDPTINNPQANPSVSTRYYVLVENALGCTETDSVDVTVIDHYIVQATADRLIACEGDSLQLHASGGGTYNWVPTLNMNNANLTNPKVKMLDTTIFTVYSSNICFTDSAKVTVYVKPYPIAKAYKDTSLCYGDFTQLRADTDPSYTYTWTPDYKLTNNHIYNPVATPLTTTKYYLEVSNGYCSKIDSTTIIVMPKLVFNVQPSKSEGVSPLTVDFGNYSTGGSNYVWTFGDGDTSYAADPTHTYKKPGRYKVHLFIYNSLGCFTVDSFYVTSVDFYIPNLITPNNDHVNDRFEISTLGNQFNVEIYNRWGDLVFKKENYKNEWAAEGQSDGIYYFSIKDKESNKDYNGWVQVVR